MWVDCVFMKWSASFCHVLGPFSAVGDRVPIDPSNDYINGIGVVVWSIGQFLYLHMLSRLSVRASRRLWKRKALLSCATAPMKAPAFIETG